MSQSVFELKGSLFTLSVLHIYDANLSSVKAALQEKLSQAPNFFFRAPIIANLEHLTVEEYDFCALNEVLTELALVFVGITSTCSATLKEQAKAQGFAVLSYSADKVQNQPKAEQATADIPPVATENKEETPELPSVKPTKIIQHTVRSGQQIYAQGSDLVVLGAVSNGAEVIADGSIHIYGTLRGRAIAGAQGNDEARIFTTKMEGELVSIAGNYLLSEHLQGDGWSGPAVVQLVEEKISVKAIE